MNLAPSQYMALWAEMERMRIALERIAAASEAIAWPASKGIPAPPRTPACACPADCQPTGLEYRGG